MSDGDEETFEEQLGDAQDLAEAQQEYQEELADSIAAGYPQAKEQLGLYQMFWKILEMKDSTKVAFADKNEVGQFNLSIRGNQHMAHICKVFNYPEVAKYFNKEGEIILSTTMGRDGNFPKLFVTQKKETTRKRSRSNAFSPSGKWRLFKGKSEESNEGG